MPTGRLERFAALLLATSALVLAIASPAVASSSDETPRVDTVGNYPSQTAWTTREGLPHDSVRAFAETRDGYLWIGTRGGLARFDGRRFTVFDRRNTDAIRDPDIAALAIVDDTLWIGSDGGGLIHYRDGRFARIDTNATLGTGRVITLLANAGGLFVGTYGGGLGRLVDGRIERTGAPEIAEDDVVRDLVPDGRGGLFAATYDGLKHWPGERGPAEPGPAEPGPSERAPPDASTIRCDIVDERPSPTIFTLARADGDTLWVGTTAGLERVDSRTGCRVDEPWSGFDPPELPDPWIVDLFQGADGSLWIATGNGLVRWRRGVTTTEPAREGGKWNGVFFEDSSGALWIGTAGSGAHQLRDGAFTTFDRWAEVIDSMPTGLTEDADGGMWVVGIGGVARLQDGETTVSSTPRAGPIRDIVWTAMVDSAGRLWVGTQDSGTFRYERGGWTRLELDATPGFATAFAEDHDGAVWLATNGGLNRIVDDRVVRRLTADDGLPTNQVRSLRVSGDTLWVGTIAGLARVEADGTITPFGREGGLSNLEIVDIYEDRDGRLWLATAGGGLVRFVDGRGDALTTREGLADDTVFGVTEDAEGWLWLCTSRGVVRLARDAIERAASGATLRQTLFGRRHGLRSPQCASGHPAITRARDGRIWATTLGGPAVVDPRRLHVVPAPLALVESLSLDDREVDPLGELVLDPDHREIQLQLGAPTLAAPDAIDLRYRMVGLDADWHPASEDRLERYTRLPPGEYTFEVQASDSTGAWTGTITSFALRVRPRLHQTIGFWIALVALAGSAVYGLHRRRVRHLERHEAELSRRVDEALSEIEVLSGLLPICASCKKIRDDGGDWTQIETYIDQRSAASFSHALCPSCLQEHLDELAEYPGPASVGR